MAQQKDDHDRLVAGIVIVAVVGVVMVLMVLIVGLLVAVLLFAIACDVVAWVGLSFGVGLRRHCWTWIGPPTMPLTRGFLSVFSAPRRASRRPAAAPVDPAWPPPRMPLETPLRFGDRRD